MDDESLIKSQHSPYSPWIAYICVQVRGSFVMQGLVDTRFTVVDASRFFHRVRGPRRVSNKWAMLCCGKPMRKMEE